MRPPHEIDFGRGDPLPLCRYCDQPIDADIWARDEPCPVRWVVTPIVYPSALSMYKYLMRTGR